MTKAFSIPPPPAARFTANDLAEMLAATFASPAAAVSFAPLAGDASARRYFRVRYRRAAGAMESLIVMQLEQPAAVPENDFTRVLTFLRGLDLPVPRLFHFDAANGLLLLEDCGDVTLEDAVREADGAARTRRYREAVELLANLHARATESIRPDCPAYHLRFDVEKLMWEFDFMIEHYVRGLLQTPLNAAQTGELRRRFEPLCATLAAQCLCFTHRDYHSRNLMVHRDRLVMLDFQDARMGPCQYDLASLLKDSYVPIDDATVDEMIDLYLRHKERRENAPVDRAEFLRVFDLMAIQRNLKAVGTFAYQSVVRKNDRYLPYIARTLGYARRTFARRPELEGLRKTLAACIPTLADGAEGNP